MLFDNKRNCICSVTSKHEGGILPTFDFRPGINAVSSEVYAAFRAGIDGYIASGQFALVSKDDDLRSFGDSAACAVIARTCSKALLNAWRASSASKRARIAIDDQLKALEIEKPAEASWL